MMSKFEDRRAGLLFGSFIAEAIALGVHWIYDPAEIVQKTGRVEGYTAPGADSYHPRKNAGDQGHVGDQALVLTDFLSREREWNPERFMRDWLKMWEGYEDYFDHATKTVLANVKNGAAELTAASPSDELAGPARSAPLIAFLANQTESDVIAAAVEHNRLTHDSPAGEETTVFLAATTHRLLQGADLLSVVRDTAPPSAFAAAEKVLSQSPVEAIGRLGQSCAISCALPAVLYLTIKHGGDLKAAFVENAMAGGDSCARGLALGMLLGAAHGMLGIPEEWRSGLMAKERLERLLAGSDPVHS